MEQVVIFGMGQWADLAQFYLSNDSKYEVAAFTVDRAFLNDTQEFRGHPVVAFEDLELHYPPDRYRLFVPLSFKKMNHVRAEKYLEGKRRGYRFVSYVSSKATTFSDFTCGENCFILEDNTIQPFVTIGNNVVMWSGNHIGHHTVIRDHVMITSQVVISGMCTIEEYCFFGVNAAVRDEATIAHDTLVGMGVSIVKDTQPYEVYRTPSIEPAKIRSDQLRSLSYKSSG
jgi:sugar O-acyltransferase (sialic acid O-acetyltransferase NeuD family)